MDSLSPNIFVDDINETIAFYQQLGFQLVMTVPDASPFDWAMMVNGNVTFMFQTFSNLGAELPQISRESGASMLFYIKVKAVRSFYEQIKDKVNVLKGLETTFYGATEFSILDINDYVLTFAEDE